MSKDAKSMLGVPEDNADKKGSKRKMTSAIIED